MSLSMGQIINNRYRIVQELGQGGFGAVYKAWDMNLSAPCAVKENFKLLPAEQDQFAKEARLLFKLKHPNLPSVHDLFTLPGLGQFLVMDFIDGANLAEVVEVRGILPEMEAVSYITQVCDALTYLHSQSPKVIHRDIKPSNIKVTPQGQVFLVDFGIAKTGEAGQSTTGAARGVTPGYSPPEQYGHAQTDARTDIYALGATLYALLTGQEPPDSTDRVVGVPLLPPRQANAAIQPALEAVILKSMQLQPSDRYQSAAEFKTAIIQGSQGILTPSPKKYWKWIGLGAGVLAALSILVFLTGSILSGRKNDAATQTHIAFRSQPSEEEVVHATVTFTTTKASSVQQPVTSSPLPPSPTLTSTLEIGSTWISPVDGMVLAFIPAGTFLMGEDAGQGLSECRWLYEPFAPDNCELSWFTPEGPVHRVTLDAFYMDTQEVTNSQYEICVAEGACTPPHDVISFTRSSYYGDPVYADYPVIRVDWGQARTYCSWAGRRLPTEAEWEYAARGGFEGLSYPWGDSFNGELANFCDVNCPEDYGNTSYDDGFVDTAPAGSYPPNGYGLYDMAGNVAEWIWDWFSESYYSMSPTENPTGPLAGTERVFRNGSWDGFGYSLRSANRNWGNPLLFMNYTGIRCALTP
jgi:formylglycine-generating enzyme required for sulfatase activity/predicted Ser/Thr protein kinase